MVRSDSTWNAPEFMFTENYQQAVQDVYVTVTFASHAQLDLMQIWPILWFYSQNIK